MASKAGRPPNYYAILEVSETAKTSQIRDAYKRAALKTHPDRVPADHPDRAERTRRFQLVNDAYYTLSDATRRREYDVQRKLFPSSSSSSSRTSGGRPSSSSSFGGGGTSSQQQQQQQHMPGGFGFATGGGDPFAEAEEEEAAAPGGGGGGGGMGGGGSMPFSWAWDFFTGGQGAGQEDARQERAKTEDEQFADVFEEMLREEGMAEQGPGATPTGSFWGMLGGLSGGALGFIVANVPGLVAGAVAGNRLGAVRDAKGKSVYAVFQGLPQTDRARLLSQMAARVLSHAVGV
ncbi:hypothetical protein C8A00DRAFT_45982 [Chaetomidium leptoderma]|uniref:J domain-containing protein n=1 Tax=Chaetomidium leptoderma TaxID=669021 RepID=A0AAN6VIA4_9PEZI|nr:hypothetical protein C8A00DRAFT_45982 [Chaetomidium leptoderma]